MDSAAARDSSYSSCGACTRKTKSWICRLNDWGFFFSSGTRAASRSRPPGARTPGDHSCAPRHRRGAQLRNRCGSALAHELVHARLVLVHDPGLEDAGLVAARHVEHVDELRPE